MSTFDHPRAARPGESSPSARGLVRLVALVLLVASVGALAQDPASALRVERAAEPPHERAVLIPGTGTAHLPITSASASAQAFFDQGLAWLHGGSDFEAWRAFREVIALDADCAMGHFGIALASGDDASRAVAALWEAFRRREKSSPRERRYIAAYARCFGAESAPEMELVDAERGTRRARATAPGSAARARLRGDLAAIASDFPDDVEAGALLLRERALAGEVARAEQEPSNAALRERILRAAPDHPVLGQTLVLADGGPSTTEVWACGTAAPAMGRTWTAVGRELGRRGRRADAAWAYEAAARADHAWLARVGAMPYEVAGYAASLEEWGRVLAARGRVGAAAALAERLLSLPRHPGRRDGAERHARRLLDELAKPAGDVDVNVDDDEGVGPGLPLDAIGPAAWSPPPAPGFDLPRGEGGTMTLAQWAGRPVLVVFYLGFGCIHCVEQLNELRPRVADFAKAGVPIVTIGTDAVNQVRAAIQQSLEADQDPPPFPILCDPQGVAFRAWRCWDDYEDEALHGTFLVDGEGRIRWRDVSVEPFMATDFLLAECRRLLAAPADTDGAK